MRFRCRVVLAVCAVVAAGAMPGTSAAATGGARDMVSSDGHEVRATSLAAAAAGLTASPGSRGTGRLSPAVWKAPGARYRAAGPVAAAVPCCGVDKRVRITNTTAYPFRAIGQITFSLPDGSFICTGWLISPNTVATAGHCVHAGSGGANGFASNVRFFPGRNGASNPFGGCAARTLHTVNGWANGGDERFDYGAIKLNCSIGNQVGWFGYHSRSTTLNNIPIRVGGYPGDKPAGTQWESRNCSQTATFVQCSVRASNGQQVFYQNDTAGGMSGGPVYPTTTISGCGTACGIAIHAYGPHPPAPHTQNHGTRINQAVFNFLTSVRNMP